MKEEVIMIMELFRGPRNRAELEDIFKNETAGGRIASTNPRKPSEDECETYSRTIKGTSGECMPPKQDKHIETEFTEYTSDPQVAMRFGRRLKGITFNEIAYCRGAYVQIEVNHDYVVELNDPLEYGYLIRSNTPLVSVQIKPVTS